MRLRKMDAGRADLLPKIGDGVEVDELRAALGIRKKDIDDLKQDIRICKVEVHLVGTEGRPHLALSSNGFKFGKQWQSPRTDNL